MTTEERSSRLEHARHLLELTQSGDRVAEEQLIVLVRDYFMPRRIGRYIHRNRQLEDDDLRQEFLIGFALAIPKARMDIGDPVEYLIQQGVYRVRSALRSGIMKNTMQICQRCGHVTRLNRIGTEYVCKKCGSNEIQTEELNDHDELTLENQQVPDTFTEEIASELFLDGFESTLKPGTNVHSLYLLLKEGIDRDNPNVKNYIKEIATMWGGCSEQNVVQSMNKLKKRFLAYTEGAGMDMACGTLFIIGV